MTDSDYILHNTSLTELKHGMRKVSKEQFNSEPERYELRRGHTDLPACPYGNKFSMMGYDNIAGEYVWLVRSIMKDSRLTVSLAKNQQIDRQFKN